MDSHKTVTIIFFLALLGMGYYSMNAAPVVNDDTNNITQQGGIEWTTDADAAFDSAQQQDKPVLVYYYTTWCTYCDTYNDKHYRNDTVRTALDQYVLLAINIDDPGAGESLLRQHEASFPPQHRVVTPGGEITVRIQGYLDQNQLFRVLQRAATQTEQDRELTGPQSTNETGGQ